ncbi:hypothetical protein H2204_006973 [Knufia peltigerae]|uniref:Methyltransferase type 12 domain-containing protein n=1 Tax=Knufia peltigerae TaxID=1002370 RepID=A0AA39CYD1_9EURO|nr:hypothetical protein H2204_006973 [Knufia peltigerae]
MDKTKSKPREHFDQTAISHQTDFAPILQATIDELRSRRSWILNKDWKDVRLLDYACGAGTVSKALLPFIKQAVGLDFSKGMVTEYNKWASQNGLDPSEAYAHQCDLLDDDEFKAMSDQQREAEQLVTNFDVVVVGSALHHVDDQVKLLSRLAGCLVSGGVCVVLDKAPDPDSDGNETDMMRQPNGYTEQDMRKMYSDAGLGRGFEYTLLAPVEFTLHGRLVKATGFIARGEAL